MSVNSTIKNVILSTSIIILMICIVYLFISFYKPLGSKNTINPVKVPKEHIIAKNKQELEKEKPMIQYNREVERRIAEENPPEIQRLEKLLSEFENDKTKWENLITAGDIYHKGAYPRLLPNEEMGIELYRIASVCPNGEVSGIGMTKYIEARKERINSADKAGRSIPTHYGYRMIDVATNYINQTPRYLFEKPHFKIKIEADNRNNIDNNRNINENIVVRDNYEFDFDFQNLYDQIAATTANIQTTYKNDSQNVHDHSVVQTTKKNLEKLRSETPMTRDYSSVEEQVRNIILEKDLSAEERQNALDVLEKLSNNTHSSFNLSEKDTLALVWNNIESTDNHNVKENLKETLAKQLASAYENGHVVCSTGKVARIVGTLDGTKMDTSRPMWAVKEEIGSLAAKIRDQYPEDEDRMKQEFERKAKETYVNQLGMKDSIISPIINMYMEGF